MTLRLIIAALAVFRLTVLITKDDGPGYIFWKLRQAPKKGTSLRQGISCPWCMSMWMSLPIGIYEGIFRPNTYADTFLLCLALSAVAIILNQAFTRD